MGGAVRTWGRLLRVPNLFTVPGDALAGYLLARDGVFGWPVLGAVLSVVLLYGAGLLLNDLFDRKVDARERPDRPIPSGAVKPATVLVAGGLFLAAGVAAAWGFGHGGAGAVAALLALAVVAYDGGLKKVRWVGPAVMGSCRAGSVLVGATFGFAPMCPPVVAAAMIVWAYTTAVTVLAAGEATGRRLGYEAFVPVGLLVIAAAALLAGAGPAVPAATLAIVVLGLAIAEAAVSAERVRQGWVSTPAFIGRLIRILIPLQAAWCLWSLRPEAMWPWAAVVVAVFVALRLGADLAGRRFSGS